jgi:hypothetical protein
MASVCISWSVLITHGLDGLLKITSEPHCGRNSKSQLTSDLVSGVKDFTDINRTVLSVLECLETFLVK